MTRWTAAGALLGLVVALAFSLAMPTRWIATAYVAMRPGSSFVVPPGAGYTPRAQLYGALGPGQQRASVTFTASAATRRRASRLALGAARSYGTRAPVQSVAVRAELSPRPVRDTLLGLIAGALVALALLTTVRRWRESFRW